MIRLIKSLIIVSVALFFSLAAYDNIVDYETNWQFVQHVMNMDSIYPNSALHKRAILDKEVQHFAYSLIILCELITALLLWISAIGILKSLSSGRFDSYRKAIALGSFGLTLGFLLYMIGFIDIGGEWFAMWQSQHWNGQLSASIFLIINLLALIMVSLPENE